MNRNEFFANYREYKIVKDGSAKRTMTLARFVLIQYKGSIDLFLLDSGGWDGVALILKVDFDTGKCFNQTEDGYEYLGTLEKIPTQT